jgi:hypothetical protein
VTRKLATEEERWIFIMKIYSNQVDAISGGITYTIIAVLSYFMAIFLAGAIFWGFVWCGLPLYACAIFLISIMHPIGILYIPISIFLIYKFIQGNSSILFLFILTFVVNFGTLYVIESYWYPVSEWILTAILAMILLTTRILLTNRKKKLAKKKIEKPPTSDS